MPRNIFGDPYNRLSDFENKIKLINQQLLINQTNQTDQTNQNLQQLDLIYSDTKYLLAVNNDNSFYIDQYEGDASTFYIDTNKNIGIGTNTPDAKLNINGDLHVNNSLIIDQNATINGNIYASNINQTSDIRLKSNIEPLIDSLSKVEQLRGVRYDYYYKKNIGLIAQEVEKIVPEVVDNCHEYKSISYGNLIALLVEAIKELNEKIKKLELNQVNINI